MSQSIRYQRLAGVGLVLGLIAAGAGIYVKTQATDVQADDPAAAQPQAVPVSVAVVRERETMIWDAFSGRLEAVERVQVRPRVSGAIEDVHFREGELVEEGELLVTIDPAPYAAEVAQAEAQVKSAEARVSLTRSELDRGEKLSTTQVLSKSVLDQRTNAYLEAEASLRRAQAILEAAQLRLGYTKVRAPVAGRVGRLEVTQGNLVSEGPAAPVLTTLVSVDPIYASFNASEQTVLQALTALGDDGDAHTKVDQIPVEMETIGTNGSTVTGHLQLIDNQVDADSGTVRVRAVFPNPDGTLLPGQFARIRMGQPHPKPALLVNERAIGTDQDKKYVFVVNGKDEAEYRQVSLGPSTEGLRVVTDGLKPGERIVVSGVQRVRPGAAVAPKLVSMDGSPTQQAQNTGALGETAER